MIQNRFGRPHSPMSIAENEVLAGLERLPSTYEVRISPPAVQLNADDWDGRSQLWYEPDFIVTNPLGKRLVIEVKSESSLSLANMVRFVAIDRGIRETGSGFLLLVCGTGSLRSRATTMPEFSKLHIRFVSSPSEIVSAIESEFVDLMH